MCVCVGGVISVHARSGVHKQEELGAASLWSHGRRSVLCAVLAGILVTTYPQEHSQPHITPGGHLALFRYTSVSPSTLVFFSGRCFDGPVCLPLHISYPQGTAQCDPPPPLPAGCQDLAVTTVHCLCNGWDTCHSGGTVCPLSQTVGAAQRTSIPSGK